MDQIDKARNFFKQFLVEVMLRMPNRMICHNWHSIVSISMENDYKLVVDETQYSSQRSQFNLLFSKLIEEAIASCHVPYKDTNFDPLSLKMIHRGTGARILPVTKEGVHLQSFSSQNEEIVCCKTWKQMSEDFWQKFQDKRAFTHATLQPPPPFR